MKILVSLLWVAAIAPFSVATAQGPETGPGTEDRSTAGPPELAVKDPMERIQKIGENEYALDEIRFNSETGEIRFPAKVNMTKDQIEYIIVTEIGKTHESLLSTETSPFLLNVAMLLCRYQASAEGLIRFVEREGPDGPAGGGGPVGEEPGGEKKDPIHPFGGPTKVEGGPKEEGEKKPINNLLQIFVRYKKDGKDIEVLIDDWILNSLTKKSLEDVFWVYTGSMIIGGDFGAQLEGSIVAIYVDQIAMFNNPIKDNDNDDIWFPHEKEMPEVGTPVEVILRRYEAPKEGEDSKVEKGEE